MSYRPDRSHQSVLGVVKALKVDRGFGFIKLDDDFYGKDVHFKLYSVVCNGGLDLEQGDRVKCWLDDKQRRSDNSNLSSSYVEVISFKSKRRRRLKALLKMEEWRRLLSQIDASDEDNVRAARLQASTCLAVWREVAHLLAVAMHPQWSALADLQEDAEIHQVVPPVDASNPNLPEPRGELVDSEPPARKSPPDGQLLDGEPPGTLVKEEQSRSKSSRFYKVAEQVMQEGVKWRSSMPCQRKQMRVDEVFFTHGEVSCEFRNGGSLTQLLGDMRRGRVLPAKDPRLQLEVFKLKGRIRSLNNRRLWVLKEYQREVRRLSAEAHVEVGVNVHPICVGTAQIIFDVAQALPSRDGSANLDHFSYVTVCDAIGSSLEIGVASTWVLEHQAMPRENIAVSEIKFAGETIKDRNERNRSFAEMSTTSWDELERSQDAREALEGKQVVDIVQIDSVLYFADRLLGKTLKCMQTGSKQRLTIPNARIIPLDPLTAKLMLANSSSNNGYEVHVRDTIPDNGDWCLSRIVFLLLDLSTRLCGCPRAKEIFGILASSRLLGEQSAACRALQVSSRFDEQVRKSIWPFIQQLSLVQPRRLILTLPVLKMLKLTTPRQMQSHAMFDAVDLETDYDAGMMRTLSTACIALAAGEDDFLSHGVSWQCMPLVPSPIELKDMRILPGGRMRGSSQPLPVVRTNGRYRSVGEYMDTYFRLLREDCNAAIRYSLADFRDRGKEAELAKADGNVFSAELIGCTVGKGQDSVIDSRLKVILKIKPMFSNRRWRHRATRFFMYGNLIACIVDSDFNRPIWALAARRDLEQGSIALDLYSDGRGESTGLSEEAGSIVRLDRARSIVLVASPTYFRSNEPILRVLQNMDDQSVPFTEELIQCKVPESACPNVLNGGLLVDRTLVFKERVEACRNRFQLVGCSSQTKMQSWTLSPETTTTVRMHDSDPALFSVAVLPRDRFCITNLQGHQIAIVKAAEKLDRVTSSSLLLCTHTDADSLNVANAIAATDSEDDIMPEDMKAITDPYMENCEENAHHHVDLVASDETKEFVGVEHEIVVQTGPGAELRFRPARLADSMQELKNDVEQALSQPEGALATSTTWDQSQLAALLHALQNRVTLIQGPPGTGKTFIGYKLLQLLLPVSRILVLTYKNHALDDFLEHAIKGGHARRIVRVGRRSDQSSELQACHLKALKSKAMSKQGWEEFSKEGKARLNEVRSHRAASIAAVAEAQEKVRLALDRFRRRGIYTSDIFLANINSSQLIDFLQKWGARSHNQHIHRWLSEAASDTTLDSLPEMLVSSSGAPLDSWQEALQACLGEALRSWYPPRGFLDNFARKQMTKPQADMLEQMDDQSWMDFEFVEVKTAEECEILLAVLSDSLKVVVDMQLRPGISLYKGWALQFHSGSLSETSVEFRNKVAIRQAILQSLPAKLCFEEDDEANREMQMEIEAERLAAGGVDASDKLTAEENKLLVSLGPTCRSPNWDQCVVDCLLVDNLSDDSFDLTSHCPHLYSLDSADRSRLILAHLHKHSKACMEELHSATLNLSSACKEEEAHDNALSIEVMRRKKIIGMTVTGASINAALLREVKPDVVLIEEAAEVLEPQILGVLGPWVKQIIQIGDHRQLPPPVETYTLRRNNLFDTSMMERLILNHLPNIELHRQGRMLPSLSKLLKPIYPSLLDNLVVVGRLVAPACVASEVFWWDCKHVEESGDRSHTNIAECERVVGLVQFFICQGYKPTQITVLAAYQGQVAEINRRIRDILPKFLSTVNRKRTMSSVHAEIDSRIVKFGNRVEITPDMVSEFAKLQGDVRPPLHKATRLSVYHVKGRLVAGRYIASDLNVPSHFEGRRWVELEPDTLQAEEHVQVHTIDRYQGDENDIVIVSLVRSNKDSKLGFLGSDDGGNRMCVAQSRARIGLYFVGNATCLGVATHWKTFLDLLRERNCLGECFPQRCPRHPDVQRDAKEAPDLCITEAAVCGKRCGHPFECGIGNHLCERPCHPDDLDNEGISSHAPFRCPYKTTKTYNFCLETPRHQFSRIRCGHDISRKFCPYSEEVQCPRVPWHKYSRDCGQFVVCDRPCTTVLDCGHVCSLKCGEPCEDRASCTEPTRFPCPKFVEHDLIWNPCNATEDMIASSCRQRCRVKLACGHNCANECGQACSTVNECKWPCRLILKCGHKCTSMCSHPCFCSEPCDRKLPCGHLCAQNCGQPCTPPDQCKETCDLLLKCGHKCAEPCSSTCICKKPKVVPCGKNERHQVRGLCHEDASVIAARCTFPCQQQLPCGHECQKLCRESHDHDFKCLQKCKERLPCGHACDRYCSDTCTPPEECRLCQHERKRRRDEHSQENQQSPPSKARPSRPPVMGPQLVDPSNSPHASSSGRQRVDLRPADGKGLGKEKGKGKDSKNKGRGFVTNFAGAKGGKGYDHMRRFEDNRSSRHGGNKRHRRF